MLRRLLRALTALLGLSGAPAQAVAPALHNAIVAPLATAKPFGPGSPGFLPTCSSVFNVGVSSKYSGTFTNAAWAVGDVPASPVTTIAAAPGVVDPMGGHNAYALALPALPLSTSNVSQLYESSANITYHGGYPNTFYVWVLGPAGNYMSSNEQITSTSPEGTATVMLTGKWQQIFFTATPSGGTHYFTIGPDLRDPTQYGIYNGLYNATTGTINHTGSLPAQTVYIFGSQVTEGSYPLPYSATTNVNANSATPAYNAPVNVTANCPPGVAFRNFASLQVPLPATTTPNPLTFAGIDICQGNKPGCAGPASGPGYEGVGAPKIYPNAGLFNGVWYAVVSCIGAGHGVPYAWASCLYSTADPKLPWTFQGVVGPIGGIPGTGGGTPTYALSKLTMPVQSPPWGAGSIPTGLSVSVQGLTASACTGTCPTFPSTWTIDAASTGSTIVLDQADGFGTTATMAVNASYGATFAQTASVAAYQLHAAPLPAGCTYSSTFYKYCWLVSGQATGALTSGTISLMYTNSLTTFPFNFSASSVINNTTLTSLNNQYAFQTDPGLASCVLVAGYYECVSSVGDNAGKNTVLYTISASADMASINFVAFDYAIRPTYSANWDTGYDRIDSHLYFNKHGFYEYFYTAYDGSNQYIGYAVAAQVTLSNGLLGPGIWYIQNACGLSSNNPGCVLPASSAFFQGAPYVGESSPFEWNGLFMFKSNADNGTDTSQATLGLMPDY